MRNKLEHILLSVLLGLSILLALSFWLNTIFNFNMFCPAHWDELAKLQVSHTPIATGFYVSFAISIFVFLVGVYLIYRPTMRRIRIVKQTTPTPPIINETSNNNDTVITKQDKTPVAEPVFSVNRPPRLNLPKNMAQIVAQNNAKKEQLSIQKKNAPSENHYNPMVSEIFSDAGYIVKPNPTISGFIPNLFAIGKDENVWIGGIDCDLDKIMKSIEKLRFVFQETLEDIPIYIHGFILDTMNKYDSENSSVLIFKSIDDLKSFIDKNPAGEVTEEEKGSFDSYSEYIDTIIQYIKNI